MRAFWRGLWGKLGDRGIQPLQLGRVGFAENLQFGKGHAATQPLHDRRGDARTNRGAHANHFFAQFFPVLFPLLGKIF